MLSFWERESFLQYDLIVLGSGIVGLSTAISFQEIHPDASVLVLERGIFPTGASTKNAGFACYGSAAEIWHDLRQLGEAKALEVVSLRVEGLKKLRQRLGDAALGYEALGGGEFILKHEDFDPGVTDYLNKLLHPFFGKSVFHPDRERVRELGFRFDQIKDFITNTVEGQIDTGRMMKNLLAFARQKNIEILTGCQAALPEQINGQWSVPLENSTHVFSADRVAVCTNAFTPLLFPDLDIKPGRGQVLITKPIENLKFKGIFHFDEGYYYFRNVGNRVLFGGGRNLDFSGEETMELALNQQIQRRLEDLLVNLVLPENTPFTVDQRWAGIMAFGSEKVPVIRNVGNGLVFGVRMNGMGIAMGSEVGARLAALLK